MRKIALLDYGKLQLQDNVAEIEKITKGTVKVLVKACSICGSDLALYRGQRSLKNEKYFGHEFSGIVLDAGDKECGIAEGMSVASELRHTCGRCINCINGLENYCKSMNDALLPGGFSEQTLVLNTSEYSFLSPIPKTLSFETASLLEPTNCAYRIALKADLKPGENVVIFGLGAMGIITAIILKSLGAGNIIGVDRNPERLNKVKALGLMELVNANDVHWQDKVRSLSSIYGADVVIEATGAVPVLGDSLDIVRRGGKIVVASVYHSKAGDLNLLPIMRKELSIVGAKGPYPHRDSDGQSATVRILNKLSGEISKLISVYDYKDALLAFDDALSGKAIKAVIRFD